MSKIQSGGRTLVIVTWFGPLPVHFSLWAKSCGANPHIDFLLVTDQRVAGNLMPPNVRINRMQFKNVIIQFARHTGMTLTFSNPHKMCDFKPLYHLLACDLEYYDYWGFCDLDVIFGDLSLVTRGRLGRYDMLLGEGHLRFLRNCTSVKNAWRHLDWRRIFSDQLTVGMDEHHYFNRLFARGNKHGFSWYNDPAKIADIDPGYRQFRLIPNHKNYRVQSFLWDGKKIFREFVEQRKYLQEEFAYIHFQKRSMQVPLPEDYCSKKDGQLVIGPAGFTQYSGEVFAQAIKERNRPRFPNAKEIRLSERHHRRMALRLLGISENPFEPVDNI